MAAPDPAALERQWYVDMHLKGVDDPSKSLAQLRNMGGGGVNAYRAAVAQFIEDDATGETPDPGVTDHGALTGLLDDDHPQYLTDARADLKYITIGSPVGVTDHGLLTGLGDDDHPQYHDDTRGDARYYTKSQITALLGVKQYFFTFSDARDTLTVGTGTLRLPNPNATNLTVKNVVVCLWTAPTGATLIVDVNVTGTTIFSDQTKRPAVAVSTTQASSAIIGAPTWPANAMMTVDIDQIGSTVAGGLMTVTIVAEG